MADNPVKYDCLVAEFLDGRRVVLNKGGQDGISQGDKFIVFSLGGEIHDPKTGESLGVLEKIKGKGEVIHVQDHMCTIETYEFDMTQVSEQSNYPLAGAILPPALVGAIHSSGKRTRTEKVYRQFAYTEPGDYARRI